MLKLGLLFIATFFGELLFCQASTKACRSLFLAHEYSPAQKNWQSIHYQDFYVLDRARIEIGKNRMSVQHGDFSAEGRFNYKFENEGLSLALTNYIIPFWKAGEKWTDEIEVHGYFEIQTVVQFKGDTPKTRKPIFVITKIVL